ncbi:FKBP-type peptidyl-prolyl cis-trans isomerase [Nocardioides zeae]|uniref:peptidylprolyl isomerase n=1 Tax=Nocardioides imazamoxiresistens TaxID=3231893 RepID=A0ABU3PSV3_9ACTN|nr:FKBP-type peptidyl-prolyl cis-trans isomerase [Nocardioides zeae]MDT9592322.1 FKBP-type peptidyl-prolyl cis-trans isomerase [Nocardioides zeae]
MRAARPVRRTSAALAAALLPLGALAACGSDDTDAAGQLDQVSVSGEVGEPPTVEINGQVDPEGFASEVVVEGDGPEIADGDFAFLQIWAGNGYTGQEAFSTYDYVADGFAPDLMRVTTGELATEELTALQQSALAAFLGADSNFPEAVVDSLEGVKGGSRVVVVADAESSFGSTGQPNIGIGNGDGVVFVIDVLDVPLSGPSGTDVAAPEGTPTLVEDGDAVTGFDFTGATEPTDELQVIPLVEGDGPVVEEGATLIANYLGQTFGGDAPFDESYSGGIPRDFVVGGENAGVIEGWSQGLVGLTAGSRVILVVPPALGYGEEGNEGAGITGTDTLYFVVDVLGSTVVQVPEPEPTETGTDTPAPEEDPAVTDPAATEPTSTATE